MPSRAHQRSIFYERCRMGAAANVRALLYAPHERKKDNSSQIAARCCCAFKKAKRPAALSFFCVLVHSERRAVIWVSQALIIRLSHSQLDLTAGAVWRKLFQSSLHSIRDGKFKLGEWIRERRAHYAEWFWFWLTENKAGVRGNSFLTKSISPSIFCRFLIVFNQYGISILNSILWTY
jgi:hypothetical protein